MCLHWSAQVSTRPASHEQTLSLLRHPSNDLRSGLKATDEMYFKTLIHPHKVLNTLIQALLHE